MEQEIEIIKGKNNLKSIVKKIVIITLVITVICFIIFAIREIVFEVAIQKRNNAMREALQEGVQVYEPVKLPYNVYNNYNFVYAGCVFMTITILTTIFYFYISKMQIVVTNTRVYGKCTFGKRVDLPIDTISAIGTSFLKGIDIGTSAGKIHFKGISNNNEIHAEISKLLNNRQNKDQKQVNNTSTTEELKQYKELLDNGVITQAEFEAKKKQLLKM